MTYKLPKLDYEYDALEPFFDAATMEIHHSKHHQTYITNANTILENHPELLKTCPGKLLSDLSVIPSDKLTAVRNNVGGHFNHSLFWRTLKVGTTLQGKLLEQIIADFGSVEEFKAKFEQAALTRFGSGWAWLVLDENKKLAIGSTANQDNPLMGKEIAGFGGIPLLGLDVWEHSYYLRYQNRRIEYIQAFWNVVNWDDVSARFEKYFNK